MKTENVDKLYEFADNSVDTLDGVFGLIIGMFSGFIGATLGCRTQHHLGKNMFLKQLLMLFVILMGVNGSSDSAQHPFTLISKSFVIWGVLLMFNRMRIFSTGIVVCLFVILYMVKTLREHNKESCKDCDKKIEEGKPISTQELVNKAKMESWDSALLNTERALILGIIANVLIGCGLYMNDKKREYGYDFSYKTFFLGIQPCKPIT